MAFTDDDLKRLEKALTDPALEPFQMRCAIFNVRGIISRLKAAEVAMKQAYHLKELVCEFADKDCAMAVGEQIGIFEVCDESWREAAGK